MTALRMWVGLALALLCWGSAAPAAPAPKVPRIGLLSGGTDPARPLVPQWVTVLDRLRALGSIEGQNILIERRFAARADEVIR